ncbi:MAG: hypothetical protein M3Y17_10720 [Actinomycetota bacterium]|nr:hypothetical protein [Actinomycetota bacterium]
MATTHADQAPPASRTAAHCSPQGDVELEPVEVASEEYERKVFTTPGVVEGYDETTRIIEDWKHSL